uniref:Ig-like domain-containing protein n=1 Tax=Zoogloea sp. TaxID=49181 RepID=UPI00322041F9
TSGSTASVAENTTAVMTVTATDADQPAQTLTFSIVGGADASLFVIDGTSGVLRFSVPPDFELPADTNADNVYEVTIRVSDGVFDSDASLSISVIQRNEAPQGRDGSIRLDEDGSYVFSTADFGFSDPGDNNSNQLAAVQIVGLPSRGTLSLAGRSLVDGEWVAAGDIAAGQLRYLPPADENGQPLASLSFRVRDDGGTADGGVDTEVGTHVLTISVTPLPDAPIGTEDSYTLDEDSLLEVGNGGVLSNDADPDGQPLVAQLVSGPEHGKLDLAADGSFRFTPDADWNGVDGFSYRPSNGQDVGAIVHVTLSVAPVNDPPTLITAAFPLTSGGSVTLSIDSLLAQDGDSPLSSITYQVVTSQNGYFALTSAPAQAVSAFTHADLLAGRVVFHHQAFANEPIVVLRAGDGQSFGPERLVSVAFSPAGSIITPPPAAETPAESVVETPSQGSVTPVKQPTRPAVPGTLNPTPVASDIPAVGEAESSPLRASISNADVSVRHHSLESQVRFAKPQLALTLGVKPDGALLEFMLAAQDQSGVESGGMASRSIDDRTKLPPLPDPYVDVQLVLRAVELSGIVLSVGAVWWASRASGLIAGLLMVAPAWRTFDPLPVLGPVDESERDWGRLMDDEMARDEIGAADLFDEEPEGQLR